MVAPTSTTPTVPVKRSRRRVVLLVVVIVILAWAGAVLATGWAAYRDLNEARDAMTAARSALRDVDLAAAGETLAEGAERAEAASRRLRRPHVAPLRLVPIVNSNLRAITTLSDAVRDTAGAAGDLVEVTVEVAEDARQDTAERQLPVEDFARLAPVAQHLAETLERTVAEIEATDSRWLLGDVADARQTYLETIEPWIDDIRLAGDAAAALPIFLGRDEERRYLVGAASLSELRGGGGLLGSWTVLSSQEGRLEFGEFLGVDELGEPEGDVAAPSQEFTRRYGDRGSLRYWRNANFSPHFPSAAQVLLELWKADGRAELDGVIMVDAVTFERLVERSGPIEVAGVTTLEPGKTVQFVGLDAYAAFDDSDERKEVLGAVATSAFHRVLETLSDGNMASTIGMLGDLTQGGHLRVYSRDPDVQDVVERAGLSGGLPDVPGEYAGVYVNNLAANKVDYFTERRIEHRVRLLPDGAVQAAVDVEFHNTSPSDGYPRHVLGPWVDDLDAGDNLSEVIFVCGFDCELGPLPDGLREGGTEHGRPVAEVRLRIPAGEHRRVEYRTTTDSAWRVEDGQIVVAINHSVQSTLHESDLRVVLEIPDGFQVVEASEEVEITDGEAIWQQETSGEIALSYRLAKTDDAGSAVKG